MGGPSKPPTTEPVRLQEQEHTALGVPNVTWYRHPGLRKLYAMMPILFLGLSSKRLHLVCPFDDGATNEE
jgi:hypothetical protein